MCSPIRCLHVTPALTSHLSLTSWLLPSLPEMAMSCTGAPRVSMKLNVEWSFLILTESPATSTVSLSLSGCLGVSCRTCLEARMLDMCRKALQLALGPAE